jgi:large subunit ribosomal protein L6
MTVTFSNNQFTIKNYLGEKNPRVLDLKKYGADVKLKVKGDLIEVESHELEKAGIVATKLEAMTRETKKDVRIFQDGIYITKKPKRDKL